MLNKLQTTRLNFDLDKHQNFQKNHLRVTLKVEKFCFHLKIIYRHRTLLNGIHRSKYVKI